MHIIKHRILPILFASLLVLALLDVQFGAVFGLAASSLSKLFVVSYAQDLQGSESMDLSIDDDGNFVIEPGTKLPFADSSGNMYSMTLPQNAAISDYSINLDGTGEQFTLNINGQDVEFNIVSGTKPVDESEMTKAGDTVWEDTAEASEASVTAKFYANLNESEAVGLIISPDEGKDSLTNSSTISQDTFDIIANYAVQMLSSIQKEVTDIRLEDIVISTAEYPVSISPKEISFLDGAGNKVCSVSVIRDTAALQNKIWKTCSTNGLSFKYSAATSASSIMSSYWCDNGGTPLKVSVTTQGVLSSLFSAAE